MPRCARAAPAAAPRPIGRARDGRRRPARSGRRAKRRRPAKDAASGPSRSGRRGSGGACRRAAAGRGPRRRRRCAPAPAARAAALSAREPAPRSASSPVAGRRCRRPSSRASSGASRRSAPSPRALLRMSATCSSIQSPGSRDVTISFSPRRAPRALLGRHGQRRVDRVRQLLHVERVDGQRELAQLLVRARVLAQDRDAVALVDQRPLLGHEVHPVEHGVDHHHVVVLVGGHRLLEVVAQLEVDRHPVRRPVAVVDDRDERLDALEVLGVLGHVGPRRHQLRGERDPLGELGVLLEEDVEAGEPAQDVLGQVRAVDAQDRELAPARQQLLLELAHALARRGLARRLVVDRQRIGAHPHLAVLEVHDAALHVDLEVHQVAAALQEVAPVGARVEADDVVGEQAVEDLLADPLRQHAPGVRLRPRDVDEVVQEDVRALARGSSPGSV